MDKYSSCIFESEKLSSDYIRLLGVLIALKLANKSAWRQLLLMNTKRYLY